MFTDNSVTIKKWIRAFNNLPDVPDFITKEQEERISRIYKNADVILDSIDYERNNMERIITFDDFLGELAIIL